MKRDEKAQVFICALTILPAVTLGTAAMIYGSVSPWLWGQQAAAFVIFALLGLLRRSAQKIPPEPPLSTHALPRPTRHASGRNSTRSSKRMVNTRIVLTDSG